MAIATSFELGGEPATANAFAVTLERDAIIVGSTPADAIGAKRTVGKSLFHGLDTFVYFVAVVLAAIFVVRYGNDLAFMPHLFKVVDVEHRKVPALEEELEVIIGRVAVFLAL